MDSKLITLADDGVNTSYNALRISAQHRFSHNFTVLSVHTWSHCMQNAETYGNRNNIGSASYQNSYNRNADTGLQLYVDKGDEALPVLFRLLGQGHVPPKTVHLSRPSLDDVFLKLTGRSLRESETEHG